MSSPVHLPRTSCACILLILRVSAESVPKVVARNMQGATSLSKWYQTVAERVKDPLLREVYALAAVVVMTNMSRARKLVREASELHRLGNELDMNADDEADANSVKPMLGRQSRCRPGEDFLYELQMRQDRWRNPVRVLSNSIWQAAIDDKLIGFIYARSIGVHTPAVLWCDSRGVSALPRKWPATWGCCFAIKPLYGYNAIGIMLVDHGVDILTGWPVRGRFRRCVTSTVCDAAFNWSRWRYVPLCIQA